MKKLFTVLTFAFCFSSKQVNAWGPDGHTIVVKLAMQFLNPEVRKNVLDVLGNMPLDTAANWMDIMRANSDYDFMKPWHYIDFAKGSQYIPSTDENIVNRLIIVFNELRHKKVISREQIKFDLLVLFHLMGDLHQPLHTGYDDDLGGNKRTIQYDTLKTNLHKFWDEDLIRINKITYQDCFSLYNSQIDTIEGIHPVMWMKESRTLLGSVYDYSGFILQDNYLKKNDQVVKRQLIIAAKRLADMLNKLLVTDTPDINMQEAAGKYKNGIDAKDASKNIGKKVTACGRVYGVKTTDKVTFINVGGKYPKSPLTVVIFEKDRKNFSGSLEELFNDKNICIKGEIVEYQGKAEIIVSNPGDIIVQ